MSAGTVGGARVRVTSHLRDGDREAALRHDVADGFTATPKHLAPKWFYDEVGSELFDRITRTPEYYPTEAERSALRLHVDEIVRLAGADTLVELGSGSSDKTRVLLDALHGAGALLRYVPFDVSGSALREATSRLALRYPELEIDAVVGDFDRHLGHLPVQGRRMVAFLGGTVGNYPPGPRAALLASLADALDVGEALLLGVDLVKDPDRLVAAYDDAAGVTAAFNRNVLEVVNRALDADFATERFDHVARWDPDEEWIEMRLRSAEAQVVQIADLGMRVRFERGEEVLTEISAKFRRAGIEAELEEAGLRPVGWWTDPAGDFAVSLSRR